MRNSLFHTVSGWPSAEIWQLNTNATLILRSSRVCSIYVIKERIATWGLRSAWPKTRSYRRTQAVLACVHRRQAVLACVHSITWMFTPFQQEITSLMLLWLKVVNQSKVESQLKSKLPFRHWQPTLAARNVSRSPPEIWSQNWLITLCQFICASLSSHIFVKHGSEYKWFGNATAKN